MYMTVFCELFCASMNVVPAIAILLESNIVWCN